MIRILKILPLALILCWSVEGIGQGDCQPLLTLVDDIITDEFYQAEEINSSANITSGTVVTFQAENNILLTDGFQTTDVEKFHGYIADCDIVDAVEDLNALKHSIKLFPNPTNTLTLFEYELNEQSLISLTIVNVLGQEVMHLLSEELQYSGKHQISFDAGQLPPEIYFFKMNLNGNIASQKFVVLR